MIDHVGINCADFAASAAFYDAVLEPLGYSREMDFGEAIGYGRDGKPDFWISGALAEIPQREVHLAFEAPSVEAIHAFRDAAAAFGVEVLHEPREWPEYHPGYYAAFIRDLDGNNVEAVLHTFAG